MYLSFANGYAILYYTHVYILLEIFALVISGLFAIQYHITMLLHLNHDMLRMNVVYIARLVIFPLTMSRWRSISVLCNYTKFITVSFITFSIVFFSYGLCIVVTCAVAITFFLGSYAIDLKKKKEEKVIAKCV